MHQVQRRPLLHRLAHRRLGPADRVTLVRAVLSTVVAVLALVSLGRHVDPWLVIAVAGVALVLDRVDGEVARRTGTASDFGARFDMETDAYLIAALSVYVAPDVGWWVLLIGAARYLFLLAQSLLPRLRRPAPPRRWCKVVAVVQGVTLPRPPHPSSRSGRTPRCWRSRWPCSPSPSCTRAATGGATGPGRRPGPGPSPPRAPGCCSGCA